MEVASRIGAAGIEKGLGRAGGKEKDSRGERDGTFCAVIGAGEKLPHIVLKLGC